MLATLIALIIFCLIVGILVWLIRMLPLPAPWGNVAVVLVVLVALLLFLERVGWVGALG